MPPYFPQHHQYACSLAVLRMVLAARGVNVSEDELLAKVKPLYGSRFKNIWNTTIAKLACEYGIKTTMHADWPLFEPATLKQALVEFQRHPDTMDVHKYENPDDTDSIGVPLPLAYTEMLEAITAGCQTLYSGLSAKILEDSLRVGKLVQTSIKLRKLYPNSSNGFHSTLLYKVEGETVFYHDPARAAAMTCIVAQLLNAANGTGACMIYE